jgi:hypothetical protein
MSPDHPENRTRFEQYRAEPRSIRKATASDDLNGSGDVYKGALKGTKRERSPLVVENQIALTRKVRVASVNNDFGDVSGQER